MHPTTICLIHNFIMKNIWRIVIAVINIVLTMTCVQSFEFDGDIRYTKKRCSQSCIHGACKFEKCTKPKCPGGACYFIDCINPSCTGGACTFEGCRGSTCEGGSCNFKNVPETLKVGYCGGGSCKFEGDTHPDLISHISY